MAMLPDLQGADVLDSHRNAHRVFRERRGFDRFNPFRHIAWTSGRVTHRESTKVLKFGPITFREWPVPEEDFTTVNQIQRTLFTSWINGLIICVPAGLVLNYVRGSSPETFAVNYLAEIPLWFMCDYALEEMQKYLPRIVSDIIDIFTSNTVQLISSILLLKEGEVSLLQSSLVGGILSNILVLLGLALLFGGMGQHEQRFNRTGAQGSSSLLSIAATSSLIPTAVKQLGQTTAENLSRQSRGVAVVLLFIYFTYTICQFGTHRKDYDDYGRSHQQGVQNGNGGGDVVALQGHLPDNARTTERLIAQVAASTAIPAVESLMRRGGKSLPVHVDEQRISRSGLVGGGGGGVRVLEMEPEGRPKTTQGAAADLERGLQPPPPQGNEIKGPQLCFPVAVAVFVVTVALLYLCIDATVDSLSALTTDAGLSPTFVGLILLPVPNYDFAAVSLASDDYLGQAMKYTVGRSIQTALLVIPLVVIVSWGIGVPPGGVTLALDGFEVVSLFTTILLLNFLVVDAKVHWVHGVLLVADWILIAIAAFFVSPEPLN